MDLPAITPMMKHYFEIKKKYPDHIIFYRLGDFYEMFEQDAIEASRILNIVLTKRHTNQMCGVPYHSYKNYAKKLIGAGKKVAICEQLEDPKTAKGIVKRGVTQILTPGMLIEDDYLKETNNFICALFQEDEKTITLCWCDISTGDINIMKLANDEDSLLAELLKIQPSEILCPKEYENRNWYSQIRSFYITHIQLYESKMEKAEETVRKGMNLNSIKSLGIKDSSGLFALSILLKYLDENEYGIIPHLHKVTYRELDDYLEIDVQTMRNLEIIDSLYPDHQQITLASVIDKTLTPMGKRLFRQWLNFPFKKTVLILKRLEDVGIFATDPVMLTTYREHLNKIRDIERIYSKIVMKRVNPQEFRTFQISMAFVRALSSVGKDYSIFPIDYEPFINDYVDKIDIAIDPDVNTIDFENAIISKGYSKELDEIRYLETNATEVLLHYQEEIKKETGIANLKIRYNKIFGYFFEVSKGNVEKVPQYFIRKQTLTNAERYTTQKLLEIETKLSSAKERIETLQKKLFDDLCEEGKTIIREMEVLIGQISYIDCIAGLAYLASERKWTCPKFFDNDEINIKNGMHPVLQATMKNECVPNDLHISKQRFFHIITGPNMSGKSTYLRQNALLLYLAHIGSYVPAERLTTYTVDKIFSRIGASDDIARGQSTFLVEMSETAYIINHATKKSFVILDEVGRGTATFDGMSIAYAVSEYLIQKTQCAVLFATHYHELTLLEDLPGAKNYTFEVKEWKDTIIFLRKIKEGFTDKSYGIYVAKIAGLKQSIIIRAQELLEILEDNEILFENKREKKSHYTATEKALSLFESEPDTTKNGYHKNIDDILDLLHKVDINTVKPIEAIVLLDKIKRKTLK